MLYKEQIREEINRLLDQYFEQEEKQERNGCGRSGPMGGPVFMYTQKPMDLLNELVWKIEVKYYANEKEGTEENDT